MTKPILSTAVLTTALLFVCTPSSQAGDITSTIGVFDQPADFSGNYPLSLVNLGNFTFSIPSNFTVGSVTISGTFGNNDVPGTTNVTADSTYYVDGSTIQVASCNSPDPSNPSLPCDAGGLNDQPTPWTYMLTEPQIASIQSQLAAGSLDFNVVQNYYGAVETGPITLDIAPAPEPATFSFITLGLAGLALLRRRKI
jgi:hypothetical protein